MPKKVIPVTDEDLKRFNGMSEIVIGEAEYRAQKRRLDKSTFNIYRTSRGTLYRIPKKMSLESWIRLRKQNGLSF